MPDDLPTNEIQLPAAHYPIQSVTVYNDRAQVTRHFTGLLLQPGLNQLVITDLTPSLQTDSIRLESMGVGAVIQDVTHRHHWDKHDAAEVEQDAETLRANKLVDFQHRLNKLRLEKTALNRDRDLLDSFAAHYRNFTGSGERESDKGVLDPNSVKNFLTFRDYYAKKNREVKESIVETEKDQQEVEKDIRALEEEAGGRVEPEKEKESKQVIVLVRADAEMEFSLNLSYVVLGASWNPKYDLRVFSASSRLQLSYQAEIKQRTGEAWDEVRLILSTAQPALGGDAPELTVWKLTLNQRSYGYSSRGGLSKGSMSKQKSSMRRSSVDDQGEADVRESVAGMTFDIPSRATIPSDHAPHKVNVALLELKPRFNYVTVPKRSAHAFLKARVKNDSEYALLSGPTSIFLDNSFVAKSWLKNVSPQEEFECSLGVDPAVRITYPPKVRKQATQGFFGKQSTTHIEQSVFVRNTRPNAITVQIYDQVPMSEEDRLKVVLMEPSGVSGMQASGSTVAAAQTAAVHAASTSKRKSVFGLLAAPASASTSTSKLPEEWEGEELVVTGVDAPRVDEKMVLEWVVVIDPGKQLGVRFAYDVSVPLGETVLGI